MSTPEGREEKVRDSGIAEIPSSEDEDNVEVENPLEVIEEAEERDAENPEEIVRIPEEEEVINPQVIPPPEGFDMNGAGVAANPQNPADPGNLDGDANP